MWFGGRGERAQRRWRSEVVRPPRRKSGVGRGVGEGRGLAAASGHNPKEGRTRRGASVSSSPRASRRTGTGCSCPYSPQQDVLPLVARPLEQLGDQATGRTGSSIYHIRFTI
jgi:hypothetical protein